MSTTTSTSTWTKRWSTFISDSSILGRTHSILHYFSGLQIDLLFYRRLRCREVIASCLKYVESLLIDSSLPFSGGTSFVFKLETNRFQPSCRDQRVWSLVLILSLSFLQDGSRNLNKLQIWCYKNSPNHTHIVKCIVHTLSTTKGWFLPQNIVMMQCKQCISFSQARFYSTKTLISMSSIQLKPFKHYRVYPEDN